MENTDIFLPFEQSFKNKIKNYNEEIEDYKEELATVTKYRDELLKNVKMYRKHLTEMIEIIKSNGFEVYECDECVFDDEFEIKCSYNLFNVSSTLEVLRSGFSHKYKIDYEYYDGYTFFNIEYIGE